MCRLDVRINFAPSIIAIQWRYICSLARNIYISGFRILAACTVFHLGAVSQCNIIYHNVSAGGITIRQSLIRPTGRQVIRMGAGLALCLQPACLSPTARMRAASATSLFTTFTFTASAAQSIASNARPLLYLCDRAVRHAQGQPDC